jgi:hypothetical protein
MRVLDGAGEIQSFEAAIEAIAPATTEEYPELTYNYVKLR